jgi:hypothetical protein
MIYIEIALSIWTLIALRLFGQGKKLGSILAVLANIGWLSMWIYTKQYGFILIDAGLLVIYWERLIHDLKED